MKYWRRTTIGAICVAAVVVSACSRMSEGVPIADPAAIASSTSAPRSTSTTPTTSGNFDPPPFGVVPTNRAPVPAGTVTCTPGDKPVVGVEAQVGDPAAPIVTVAVPQGWSMTAGSGDIGAKLKGPDGATATITIAATQLDAAAAFRAYSDQITEGWAISALSFVPGELCDYSGQKLQGSLSNTPEDAIQFVDRIVHVWTNTGDYLVAVHVEAPAKVENMDKASDVLTEDVEIRLP